MVGRDENTIEISSQATEAPAISVTSNGDASPKIKVDGIAKINPPTPNRITTSGIEIADFKIAPKYFN